MVAAVPFQRGDGVPVQHEPVQQLHVPDGALVHGEEGMLLVPDPAADGGHAGGEVAARPPAGCAQCLHVVGHALRRVLPLQLGECRQYVHHGPAHGGAGVEGLLHGDEGDVVPLEDLVHGGEFLHVPADAVQLIDHHGIQHAVLDVLHHFPEAWPVGVLAGEALVPVIDPELRLPVLEDDAGIVLAQLHLDGHGVAVVTVYGFPWVDAYCVHRKPPCVWGGLRCRPFFMPGGCVKGAGSFAARTPRGGEGKSSLPGCPYYNT